MNRVSYVPDVSYAPQSVPNNLGKFNSSFGDASLNKSVADNKQSWIGGAIGALATLASAVIGSRATRKTQREANKANAELWREQTEHNEAYNDPSAVRQRLLNAGINPAGQDFSSPILANGANPEQKAPQGLGEIFNSLGSNLSNIALQSPLMRAQAEKLEQETEGLKIENSNKQEKIDAELKQMYKGLDLTDAQIQNLVTANSKLKAEIETMNREQDRADLVVRWDKEFQDWQKKNGSEKTRIDWYNARVASALADSNIGLNAKQKDALQAKIVDTMQHTVLLAQQGANIDADTISKDMDNFIRQIVFGDEAEAAKQSAESSKKIASMRNSWYVRATEWTCATFGSLLGGVGAAAIMHNKKPTTINYSHYNDFRQ